MLYRNLYSKLASYVKTMRGMYVETFDKEGTPPPPPPGGRMEYEDYGNMLFEDGTEMAYES